VPEINLVNLRKLVLNENIIETCEDFKGHNKLEILELQKNQLKNLKGLTSMENL
jgi:hypothetical protein